MNNSGKYINNLLYDINLTLEELSDDDMYFCSEFSDIEENEPEKNVNILTLKDCCGRFLRTMYLVLPLLMMMESCTMFIRKVPKADLKVM